MALELGSIETTIKTSTLPDGVEVVQVTASCTLKVNVGNYESVEYAHFMNANIDPAKISALDAAQALMKVCKQAALTAAAPAIINRDQKTESAFNNLPQEIRDRIGKTI